MPPTGPSSRIARGGGIQKQRARRDRDGDLVMGMDPVRKGPARPQRGRAGTGAPNARPQTNGSGSGSQNNVDVTVTGWSDASEIEKLTQFLERHAAKRSTRPRGGPNGTMIKRSRVTGHTLTLGVRPEDTPAFRKINGFSFQSAHGPEKLTITTPHLSASRRSTSPHDSAATTSESDDTLALLQAFLSRRYDPDLKLLNLSQIADDEEMGRLGMFASADTTSKFFPALMVAACRLMKTAEERRAHVTSITLANNNLPNLDNVTSLAQTFPAIQNLDLSGNAFASTKNLRNWKNKFRSLQHLIVSGNPFEVAEPGWEKEIISWYPRLRVLNAVEVRTDADIARIDGPKHTPVPSHQNIWQDEGAIAQNFLLDFYDGFDKNREAVILKYYDNESTFSMNINTGAKGGAGSQHHRVGWDDQLPLSRNLRKLNHPKARVARKYRGPERIRQAWSVLPPTRHPAFDTNKYSMDCQLQPGVPDPTGQHTGGVTGLLVTIHGEYEEHRTAKGRNEVVSRAFDRTFVLGPGGPSGVRVVSDMFSLRAAGGTPAWIPQGNTAAAPQPAIVPVAQPAVVAVAGPVDVNSLTPEQQQLVAVVQRETKMITQYCIDCLAASAWDLNKAAAMFNQLKDTLTADAFIAM
ncbi:hypothetical protein P154DRAFT_525984 [Amniculicola lignicola CBS 123094]|uniref:NTF2-like protein n=1 Tax=Amniculicola lignicola CBS 123094 TaxID=1392246 RepID=A0A6A5W1V8_9PLEO|nr:hypothetical protein P154DRAFT_525984 [Amniculicola lignicola CBS 123094]